MTLDEAIKHCKEHEDCTDCGQEHHQLRKWLEELKYLKENAVEVVRCENCKYKVWDEFKNCYYCNKLDFNLYGDRVLEFFCACGDDE